MDFRRKRETFNLCQKVQLLQMELMMAMGEWAYASNNNKNNKNRKMSATQFWQAVHQENAVQFVLMPYV